MPASPMAYAPERHGDLYAGFETRIVPENITLLPKTTTRTGGGNAWNERTIVLKKGDSVVAAILATLAPPPERSRRSQPRSARAAATPRPRDGYKLRVLLAPGERQPAIAAVVRVVIATDSDGRGHRGAGPTRANTFRSIRAVPTAWSSASDDDEDDGKGVRLYQSIYETALRNQVPRPVIDDLIRIYSYDVDFQRKVQPGDSFEVLFAGDDENANDGSKTEVLFASLTTGGETRKFYRYQTPDDNIVDYYDETGKSAKKFLVRKPWRTASCDRASARAIIRSSATTKMHTGVDWAAPHGHADLCLRQRRDREGRSGKAATASTSASATPTATRPPTATCPRSPAAWSRASGCARAR